MSLGYTTIVSISRICWKFTNSNVFQWVFIVDIILLACPAEKGPVSAIESANKKNDE